MNRNADVAPVRKIMLDFARPTTAYSVRNATTLILPPHRGRISGFTS
jgi:hypothetical protein